METTSFNKEAHAYRKASRRVKELKGFYGNLTSYCLVIPFLVVLNLITSPQHLWFYWPMLGWGVGIVAHGISVFGIGKEWEERKIRELMDEDRKNTKTL
ncbi:2TM domain-containing protein [Chryseobacterium sp. L7]|uniref:2TM domain-containing protein n=1 Tax=Chryseobacterium endalhagicum TaxID=2797638 RepID=A0ABS1QG94_9FLAO|nr:2TM domain-containing protein [Chryseobacterium endalhagicum]MBL1221620.1 2TM domain-containing protein [Chryseobacterium endalhagicum]